MSTTKLRATTQVYFDGDIDHNAKKITNLANGVNPQDAVTKAQLDSAVSSGSTSVHSAVQDLAACKALTDYQDKMMLLVEDLGLYRFDSQSTATSNDTTVIRPTNIASDASAGRWLKISAPLSDHNNLTNMQGGTSGEYYHLSSAQYAAATRIASGSQSGLLSSTDWTTFNNKAVITNRITREVPSGTKNGSNTAFTLANTPTSGTEMLFVNGILQNAGSGNDYTISGANITMATAPISTDTILCTYWK